MGLDAKSDHPDVVAGVPLAGANQYPDDDDIPGFSDITTTHMDHMAKIGWVDCFKIKMLFQLFFYNSEIPYIMGKYWTKTRK